MKVNDLIKIVENKLATLNNQRAYAEKIGELNEVVRLDFEIMETEETLKKLRG